MASYLAIETVCEAVIQMIEASFQVQQFDSNDLEFKVFSEKDFQAGMTAGVSLYLYRIQVNGTHRIPSGGKSNGKRRPTKLPLDLHLLLTTWGAVSMQHRIAGWMMRILEDFPILPAVLLNTVSPGVFNSDENVELVLAELSNEDLLHLWETLLPNRYQLSIPYLARNIRIESTQEIDEGIPIHERLFEFYRIPRNLDGV